MPSKKGKRCKKPLARQDRRDERVAQDDLGQMSLEEAQSNNETPAAPQDNIPRNYTPVMKFDAIKVTVECASGDNVPLADIATFETTLGKVDTVEQVHGMLKNRVRICKALAKHHDIDLKTDIVDTFICYTDAAGNRHRRPYLKKYDGDFGIWAGEVEGGDMASHPSCQCGRCSGVHGPSIEVLMKDNKTEAEPEPEPEELDEDDDEDVSSASTRSFRDETEEMSQ